MATCWLHVGLPKTGTTAVQRAFHGISDGRLHVARLGDPNHGVAIAPAVLHARGPDPLPPDDPAVAAAWAALEREAAAAGGRDLLISAENLTTAARRAAAGDAGVEARLKVLLAMLEGRAGRVVAVATLRAPASYAMAAGLQNLTMGMGRGDPPLERPRYADSLGFWEREASLVALLAPEAVGALAAAMGVPAPAAPPRANPAPTAEAAAILRRFWRRNVPSEGTRRAALALREALAPMPGRPLAWTEAAAARIRAAEGDGIAWAERLCGAPLDEPPAPPGALLVDDLAGADAALDEGAAMDWLCAAGLSRARTLDGLVDAFAARALRPPPLGQRLRAALARRLGIG